MRIINKIRKFLGKDVVPRCTATNNFWDINGYRCSLEEGHEGMHSHEYDLLDGTKAYHEWNL